MEVDQLTNEQVASLTPEQVELLENHPEKLAEILDGREQAGNDSGQALASGGEETGEAAPVVLNKSGRGIIPYEKHKELRVENSSLREQLQAAQVAQSEAARRLEELLGRKEHAAAEGEVEVSDDALARHLATLKAEMPGLYPVIAAVLEGGRKQGEELRRTLDELKREKEEADRVRQLSVAEQVQEAKENNPDLVHWETTDPEAWEEALRQDEILRTGGRWANRPYAERFEEVVRRVRAILPQASKTQAQSDPERIRAEAKARLDKAPERRPVTLSDIHGGANPASEREQIENLDALTLAQRLMKMPAHQAAAMRADLD